MKKMQTGYDPDVMMPKHIFLSHFINVDTQTYGNREVFSISKKSSISRGDVANDSRIETTVHMGTHIDMPYHFYDDGQTIEDFAPDFWVFNHPLIVELKPESLIIGTQLINILESLSQKKHTDILIIKTGIGAQRGEEIFWKENYGFDPELYNYFKANMPKLRVFGFDSISVSSFSNRATGRLAHKKFLNPEAPILLLEDMNLSRVDEMTSFERLVVAPLLISQSDGLPCTVIGTLKH